MSLLANKKPAPAPAPATPKKPSAAIKWIRRSVTAAIVLALSAVLTPALLHARHDAVSREIEAKRQKLKTTAVKSQAIIAAEIQHDLAGRRSKSELRKKYSAQLPLDQANARITECSTIADQCRQRIEDVNVQNLLAFAVNAVIGSQDLLDCARDELDCLNK